MEEKVLSKPTKSRIEFLKQLLNDDNLSTQEELVEKLEKSNFQVTQSTVSRDLRKLGAIRTFDSQGRTVYRLSTEVIPPVQSTSLASMVTSLKSNGSMIVIRTHPGSASLVGRYVDIHFSDEILGCIAGDDTVFVAPTSHAQIKNLLFKIEQSLNED